MKLSVIFLIFFCLIFGCNNKEHEILKKENDSLRKALSIRQDKPKYEIKMIDFHKEEVRGVIRYDGEILNGSRWSDKNGDNICILTEKSVEGVFDNDQDAVSQTKLVFGYLFADHNTGNYSLIQKLQDGSKDCPFDNTTKLIAPSLTITDLDTNGYAEITFMYLVGCKSDVSPDGAKLVIMENGNKYFIRGESIVDIGNGQTAGGRKKVSNELNNAPPQFLQHANEIWDKNIKQF